MKPHLYILPFNDNQFLKIGISLSDNFNRINNLSKIYDINLNNAILISSDNAENIKLLEKNIKTIINETINPDNRYYGKDGHTEIRKVKYLNDIIELINKFKPILNLQELKYNIQYAKKIQNTKTKKINIIPQSNNKIINDIFNALNNIKQYITKINLNNDSVYINLNLSDICANEKELDAMLKPLNKRIILNGKSIRRSINFMKYIDCDIHFNDIDIILYNSFRLKNEFALNESDEKLQYTYKTFINNLYLDYKGYLHYPNSAHFFA